MIPADLNAELDQLAATLLPEFANVYWLDGGDLSHGLGGDEQLWGYTGPAADLALQSHLAAEGRWVGRNPAIVINSTRLAELVAPSVEPEDLRYCHAGFALSIAVHEIAHVADLKLTHHLPEPARCLEVLLAYSANLADKSTEPAPTLPPWALGHGPAWLRILAHADHRARQAGFIYPDEFVWMRNTNVCPMLHTAQGTCHDELHELADVPLTSINDYAPPAAYAGLWRIKAQRWRETRPANDPDADRHVREALTYFQGT